MKNESHMKQIANKTNLNCLMRRHKQFKSNQINLSMSTIMTNLRLMLERQNKRLSGEFPYEIQSICTKHTTAGEPR